MTTMGLGQVVSASLTQADHPVPSLPIVESSRNAVTGPNGGRCMQRVILELETCSVAVAHLLQAGEGQADGHGQTVAGRDAKDDSEDAGNGEAGAGEDAVAAAARW